MVLINPRFGDTDRKNEALGRTLEIRNGMGKHNAQRTPSTGWVPEYLIAVSPGFNVKSIVLGS